MKKRYDKIIMTNSHFTRVFWEIIGWIRGKKYLVYKYKNPVEILNRVLEYERRKNKFQ